MSSASNASDPRGAGKGGARRAKAQEASRRLIGQSTAETLLARAVQRDRIAHAYLLLGPAGCGKTTTARLFAQAINCERQPAVSVTETGLGLHPCGACESCRRILAGTHPEVIEIEPGSKKGQNISIDQVREIRKNAALAPKMGRRRVYLFPNAELVGEASGNALLKTLEEPSAQVVLLLCAPNPSQVLPTIRSRCQIVRLNLCGPDEIRDRLTASGTTPQIAEELALAAGGRPGLALAWAQTPSILKGRRAVLDVFHEALEDQLRARRDPGLGVAALRLAEELRALVTPVESEDGPARPVKALHADNLEIGLGYLRDLMLLAAGGSPESVQNRDRLPALRELASAIPPERTLEDIHTVREAQRLLEQNVGVQIALERMFWALITAPVPLPVGLFEEVAA